MMATKKNKEIMDTIQVVLAGGAGGFAGVYITTAAEKELVKQNPKLVGVAPAVTAAVGIAGSMFTKKGTIINDAMNGVSIVSIAELIAKQVDNMKKNNGATTTTTTPPSAPPPPTQGLQSAYSKVSTSQYPVYRLNAVPDVMSNPYMY